jgi:hypothetical protein
MMHLFSLLDTGILNEMLSNFAAAVPNFLAALLIIIIGFIVSKAVSTTVKKLLEKINIDIIGDKLNEIEIVSKANVKIKISAIVSKVLYYFLLLFFVVAATDVLAMPAVSNLVTGIFNLIPHLMVAGIILILGTLLADLIRAGAQTALDSLGIPSSRMLASFIFYFLFINIVIVALTQAQINTEFLSQNISLLIGGIVLAIAIGYGLASKSTMANFLASYYISGKFDIGDTVTIDGTKGKVIDVDKSSITLISDNGNKVIFPLSEVSNAKIEIHN